jgi:hypothetical protein
VTGPSGEASTTGSLGDGKLSSVSAAALQRFVIAVGLAGLLGAAACSSDESAGTTTRLTLVPTTTTTPPSTTAPPATTTIATTTTTTAPTTTVPAVTTTTDPIVAALVLSDRGVGSVDFGGDPDGAIAYVSSILGDPTGDTGWIDPFELGACPGTEVRQVSWGALTLTFGDASNVRQGRRHLVSYSYGIDGEVGAFPVGLQTPAGITVGSRVVDVLTAYPNAALYPEDEFSSPFFFVNDDLRGYVTGIDEDATVTVVLGGQGCGE